jgi:AcrR family transcriptional regulator
VLGTQLSAPAVAGRRSARQSLPESAADERGLTAKGARQRAAIIDAAARLIGREGYASLSIARVADEASVSKRAVFYYFQSRDGLLVAVAARVGERLVQDVAVEAVPAADGFPPELVGDAFDRLWATIRADRVLVVAYLGLVAESVVNPSAGVAIRFITDGMRAAVEMMLREHFEITPELGVDFETFVVLMAAGVEGLTLEYLERGPSPALDRAVEVYRMWVTSAVRSRVA